MLLLVTEVTEMRGGNFCVAGWNPEAKRMVRPLPGGANWTAALLDRHRVEPGTTIEVTPTIVPRRSEFPHRTEDTPVDRTNIRYVGSNPIDWLGPGAPPTYNRLSEAFDGYVECNSTWRAVKRGVRVPLGTKVRSLAAVRVERNRVTFCHDCVRLRAILDDGSDRYKLAVSSRVLKEAYRNGGIEAVRAALPSRESFHVRLGLARAFRDHPTKCYLMVNGILG